MAPTNLTPPPFLDAAFGLPTDQPFTRAHALGEGVSPRVLTRLVAQGLLRRPLKGVYVAAQVPDSRETRGRALALVAPPGSVVCDWSAAWYWTGWDRPGTQFGCPPLSVYRFRGHERLRNDLVVSGQRWFKPSDVVPLEGHVSVATPLRTAWDLARFSPRIIALGGMDALARLGEFSLDDLLEGVERFKKQRGVVQLRHLAPMVDPRAESPGESALRLRWLETPDLPAPDLQIGVHSCAGVEVARLDLGVEALGLGVEYDGEQWHSTPEHVAHDEERRERLKAQGWHIEVFRRDDVFGQREAVTSRLPKLIAEARRTATRRGFGAQMRQLGA